MFKVYNTQNDIASSLQNFLLNVDPNIRKTQLNIIPFISLGMYPFYFFRYDFI